MIGSDDATWRDEDDAQAPRAVVEITPPRRAHRAGGRPPRPADAGFLSQLLAVRAGMPSQRTRRRAEPEDGAIAYRSSDQLDRDPAAPGRFSRKA